MTAPDPVKPFIPAVLDDYPLTPYEFRILCRVSRRGDCWESNATTAKTCGMSVTQVRRAKRVLVALQLLEVERRTGQSDVYRLNPNRGWWVSPDGVDRVRAAYLNETASSQDEGASSQDEGASWTPADRVLTGQTTASSQDDKGSPLEGSPTKEDLGFASHLKANGKSQGKYPQRCPDCNEQYVPDAITAPGCPTLHGCTAEGVA